MTPFMMVAATAANPQPGLFSATDEVMQLLREAPTANRRSGWNTLRATEVFPAKHTSDGIRWGDEADDMLELYLNGRLEFRCPLDKRMCWNQTQQDFERQPSLAPIALIETIVSLVRLAKILWSRQHVASDMLFHVVLTGVAGFTLRPYSPNQYGWFTPGRIGTVTEELVNILERAHLPTEDDRIAYTLVRRVYGAFGLSPDVIPFFDKDKNLFRFPNR